MKAHLEQQRRQPVLETFRKRFRTFFCDALSGSCWLQLKVLGIRSVRPLKSKMHVSKAVPCHPNDRQLHGTLDSAICTNLVFMGPNHRPCSAHIGC